MNAGHPARRPTDGGKGLMTVQELKDKLRALDPQLDVGIWATVELDTEEAQIYAAAQSYDLTLSVDTCASEGCDCKFVTVRTSEPAYALQEDVYVMPRNRAGREAVLAS